MTTFNLDDERFDQIFQLAMNSDLPASDAAISELSDEEREELDAVRDVLTMIDTSWHASNEDVDKVYSLFLQKLAAEEPNHPWIVNKLVHTLGELVRVGQDELPALPEASRSEILRDDTPLETLLDPQRRTAAFGLSLRRAQVPPQFIGDFQMWLNRAMSALYPTPKNIQQGLIYTRKQRPRRAGK